MTARRCSLNDEALALPAAAAVVGPSITYQFVVPNGGSPIPTPNYTTAPSAGDTATLSGLTLRWNEEGADQTQSEPTLKQLEITNYELGGYSDRLFNREG